MLRPAHCSTMLIGMYLCAPKCAWPDTACVLARSNVVQNQGWNNSPTNINNKCAAPPVFSVVQQRCLFLGAERCVVVVRPKSVTDARVLCAQQRAEQREQRRQHQHQQVRGPLCRLPVFLSWCPSCGVAVLLMPPLQAAQLRWSVHPTCPVRSPNMPRAPADACVCAQQQRGRQRQQRQQQHQQVSFPASAFGLPAGACIGTRASARTRSLFTS